MYDHKAVINAELDEDELLLWSDQPRQGLFLRPSDTVMVPFSLIWGGFALMWEYEVISGDAPWLFALFGLPFVIIGLYLIAGRFFYDAKMREKTFYGITDHRIIMLSGITTKQARFMPIDEIEDLYLFEKPDGSGAIVLGPEAITTAYQSELVIPGQKEVTPRLNHLRQVRIPFDIIQQLRRKHGLPLTQAD